jgi:ligand-binding sensor domain-containing protein
VNSHLKNSRILLADGSDPLLYDGSSFSIFTQLQKTLDQLTSYRKEIYSIFTEKDRNIWVGSQGNIICISHDHSEIFTIYNGVPDNLITGFAQAPDGHIWAGSWNGVSMFDGKQWPTMDIRDRMPEDWITAIAFDNSGELWFGTRSSGLLHYDGSLWEMFNTDDGVADSYITGLLIDSKDRKWITTNHGISVFTGKQKYPFKLLW